MVVVRNGDGFKMVMRAEHGLVKREVVENTDGGDFGSMIDENGERGSGNVGKWCKNGDDQKGGNKGGSLIWELNFKGC
ncbi:hypothetical protein V6N12_031653 [Hibiscus sabdariffa]|uniref:Uncharacterized protein n=1 Tax=Hibiscus sabdariffa TaxID=183260 RepID=A0ABR2DV51_9ROSI